MPITLIGKEKLHVSEVPYILASMRSNQAFSRGTFREIDRNKYLGNIAAIQSATKQWEKDFVIDPLLCLSSVELETLIAKIFEAYGCFVPAYRGGMLDHVDLFVSPKSNLSLMGMKLERDQKYCIQIKLSSAKSDSSLMQWLKRSKQHLLITLTNEELFHEQHFGRKWLQQALNKPEAIAVKFWLQHSLDWLPEAYQEPKL